ncbi:MAG: alpha/beta fold hydrolase [Hydrogenophaga sp.]|uniref:alpha/beta fold hydrolase n=1 Tax=Hydrogenophaga sp. TaxID=1904254 RepID=UPI0025BB27E1|nr:alpha/beta fold hydrolase [Hydrogenophaga sp.]MBT9549646.1 alpha/beta fold hydrolase [Hydrogenophaga sp.]
MTPPPDQFVQVGRIRTRFWQMGTQGSAVLLLHGIACSVLEWQRNIEALAAHHRVFAVDLLGSGLTDKPADETYNIPRLARFALDFLTSVGVEHAHLAGNSLGGRLALECAREAPERVRSMLLVDPAGMAERPTLLEFRLASVPLLGELATLPNLRGTRMLWRKAFADPDAFVTDELVASKCRLARLPGAQAAFLKTLRSFVNLRGFDAPQVQALQAALPDLLVPTFVVWGRDDRFVPAAHADVLREHLPDVSVQVWDRCGHAPMVECAERFNAEALAFWRGVDARAAT